MESNKVLATWQHEIYFVGQRRRDGTAPSIEKAVEERFFLTYEAAVPLLEKVSKEIGNHYGIFPGLVIIPRCLPLHRELDAMSPEWKTILSELKPH